MNIEEYISSGLIEAYVLGIASPDEVHEIERLAELHAEIREAIASEKALLETYTLSQSVTPPPALKQQIWDAIRADEDMEEAVAPAQQMPFTDMPSLPPRTIPAWRNYAMAAGLVLLAISAGINFRMMQGNKQLQADMEAMRTEQLQMQQEKDQALALAGEAREAVNILSIPTIKKIKLDGVGTHEGQSCMLYWDGANGNVYLDLQAMPQAPEGKQYQLWAIIDGKPVDAGMYEANKLSIAQMKTIARAEMFAITIEKAGGSPVPTLEQMVVAGKTS